MKRALRAMTVLSVVCRRDGEQIITVRTYARYSNDVDKCDF